MKNFFARLPRLHALGLTTFLMTFAGGCLAQSEPPGEAELGKVVPAGGLSILPEDAIEKFRLAGGEAEAARVNLVPVSGPGFERAIRAQTTREPKSPWLVQLAVPTVEPVKKGDIVLASFWIRGLEAATGEAYVGLVFETRREPFTQGANFEATAGTAWQHYRVAFAAPTDYPAGEAVLNLRLGYAPQTIEIGGVSLQNFGTGVRLTDLPSSSSTYAGRSMNSAWRKAAQERIEKHRKGDLWVRVTDAAGNPVGGATVQVAMKRHAFAFGSAVSAKNLVSNDPGDEAYRAKIKQLFNEVVLENDLKWNQWEANREQALAGARWLRDNNIRLRGHTLVWPGWRHVPSSLKALENDPVALNARVKEHIRDEAGATKGLVVDWDVLNEVYKNHDLVDVLGESAMVDWFKAARESDPDAVLYINDYGILSAGGSDRMHQDAYAKTIEFLIEKGAPIGGIGFQGHFGLRVTPPEKLLPILDRYAAYGKKLKVTEFDINIRDEALQGDYTRDFLTTMFSHPAVEGVVMWGFWEGRHYAPQAALYRKNWSRKPNAVAWEDLVLKQWWTNAEGTSDPRGTYATRGFLGDYEITVTHRGKTKTVPVSLPLAGKQITVVVD